MSILYDKGNHNLLFLFAFCLMIIFAPSHAWSQERYSMQKGIVKTKGRMVNGKHVPGMGLPGATIRVSGENSYNVQNNDGSFVFPIPSQSFSVESVQKQGYQLVDADVLKKTYQYSDNPLYLVMETPEQQTQDQLESERKIRRTLQRQLQKREDELESLKETHQITVEEYQKALQRLYADQTNNEKLISEMAKQYAQLDYDQLSELNQRIHDAISNGRLTEADSLIRSKGNMRTRIEEVKREERAEREREAEIKDGIKKLDDAKAGTQKKKDDIAKDCDILRNRFMMDLQIDSAAYYVEVLVSLDSSDVHYLGKAGDFYQDICWSHKSEEYYRKALNICRQSEGDHTFAIVALQTNLANLYQSVCRLSEAENLIQDNLAIIRRQNGRVQSNAESSVVFDEYIGQLSLAGLYSVQKEYPKAESVILNTIDLLNNNYFGYVSEEKNRRLAAMYAMLGNLYSAEDEFNKSDIAFSEAVKIYQNLSQVDSVTFGTLGGLLSFWAMSELSQEHYPKSESLFLEALDAYNIYEKTTKENQELFLSGVWFGLATLCRKTQRTSESENWYKKRLDTYRRYAQSLPLKYGPDLIGTMEGLAGLYDETGRFDESVALLMESLEICERLVLIDPQQFNPQIAFIQGYLGKLKLQQERYQEALEYLEKSLDFYLESGHNDSDDDTAQLIRLYDQISECYKNMGNYSKAREFSKKAFDLVVKH